MPATILYVRHGENTANLTGELSHRVVDHSLTERGRSQARAVAEHLAAGHEGEISAVFSSPLRRARETAAIIGEALGIDVVELEALRELNVGDLDGRSDEEAWGMHDAVDRAWLDGEPNAAFPGGEDLPTALARLTEGLRSVVERVPDGRSVVIGHGGIIRHGLANLFREPGSSPRTDPIANCAIIELEVTADAARLGGRMIGAVRAGHLAALD